MEIKARTLQARDLLQWSKDLKAYPMIQDVSGVDPSNYYFTSDWADSDDPWVFVGVHHTAVLPGVPKKDLGFTLAGFETNGLLIGGVSSRSSASVVI